MGVHVQRSVRLVTQPDACLIWQLGAQASFDFVRLRVDQLDATSAMTIFLLQYSKILDHSNLKTTYLY